MKSTVRSAGAAIRELEAALAGGNAHTSFEKAVKNVAHKHLGETPADLPYSIWQLVEHIRIAQGDILEFSRNPNHVSPDWPDGYWPKEKTPPHAADWQRSLERITADRKAFIGLLHEAGDGIYTPFPPGDGQSLFREAVLIIDHTSYHTGEIIVLRRLLNDWK
ncbi:MAG TPA: DinB family protein [Puia sp.]|nr:DinB family protein [Puia sp.]